VQEGKADVNLQGYGKMTACMFASQGGHKEIVACLVQEGKADVNLQDGYGKTACMLASEGGHKEIVAWLEQEGKLLLVTTETSLISKL
jgi:ankyrin repeat protein